MDKNGRQKKLTNSFYRVMCEQDPVLERTTRDSDVGVTC